MKEWIIKNVIVYDKLEKTLPFYGKDINYFWDKV